MARASRPHPPTSSPLSAVERQRLDDEQAALVAVRELLPRASPPYFAHMRLQPETGRVREAVLASGALLSGRVSVLDWRQTPLSEVFFAGDEGSDYALDVGERTVEGTLLVRHLVCFEGGELSSVITPERVLERAGDGTWCARPRRTDLLPARSREAARRASAIVVPLDRAQRAAVERPAGESLLVLGEAGCGKTTVALHRLAWLVQQHRSNKRSCRAAVIVPTEGLARLCRRLLDELGVEAAVWRYDRWAAAQARRSFRVPAHESANTPAAVVRLKRHPALREAIERLAPGPADDAIDADVAVDRGVTRYDLLHLFGDRALLEQVAAAAHGGLPAHAVDEVLAHTRRQFRETAKERYAHVTEPSRLEALDGRGLDDSTPAEDAGSIDVEDYAALFALDRLRAPLQGYKAAKPESYDVVVVDEAQELAPLELELVGRALRRGGTLVVAGDEAQQIDTNLQFIGWRPTMEALGARGYTHVTLKTSYRCPAAVTAMATQLRKPGSAPTTLTNAASLTLGDFASPCHRAAVVGDLLRELGSADPSASCAVIARSRAAAERLAADLARSVPLRLALDGDFVFRPGVQVTCVEEVKGLEFDQVVVPDADASSYDDSPGARRALYVACTRATHHLLVCSLGRRTPLLRADPRDTTPW